MNVIYYNLPLDINEEYLKETNNITPKRIFVEWYSFDIDKLDTLLSKYD